MNRFVGLIFEDKHGTCTDIQVRYRPLWQVGKTGRQGEAV